MPPGQRYLQANLNHSARAQDLLMQTLAEWEVGIAVVAEPYRVPDRPDWAGDTDDSVTIITTDQPLMDIRRGAGYVAAHVGRISVIGVYAPPRLSLAEFEDLLDGVGECIRQDLPRPTLVLGDFNAKSTTWGSPRTDARGDIVEEWAAGHDLRLLNRGSTSTCVRWQGESIVDLSLATPAAARMVSGWRVAEEVETLSDHLHILFELEAPSAPAPPLADHLRQRRWRLMRLNKDELRAAALAMAWPTTPAGPVANVDEEAEWLRGALTQICDASMPRATKQARRATYWWSDNIAELRRVAVATRRQYLRARRRRQRDLAREEDLYERSTKARTDLKAAIGEAKASAWQELIGSLDRDPWGRPYRIVLGRLRKPGAPVTAALDPGMLDRVVDTLFPHDPTELQHLEQAGFQHPFPAEAGVTEEELGMAINRLRGKNTAPGPDGIPGKVLAMASSALGPRLRRLFDGCLQAGRVPRLWKQARMVLIPKPGKPPESPSAYRPICLLDEAGKLFERILAARLTRSVAEEGNLGLADSQFGFREGRSTLDAIGRVKNLAESATSRGGVAVSVSLDIANAFNSLPWEKIRGALAEHQVPPYMKEVVRDYLRERYIEFPGRHGLLRREVTRGVPQGSVLGPLLWDLGYDAALRVALPPGVHLTCYADDTLVTAVGREWERTIRLAEMGVASVVAKIRDLGLHVSSQKSEAMFFHRLPLTRRHPQFRIRVGEGHVPVVGQMKYLGLVLDSRWRFEEHFDRLVPRAKGVAALLRGLMPNLGGPRESIRRLYVGVVRSVCLYGCPIWSEALVASRRSLQKLRSVQRLMAIRVARAYRTIPHGTAEVLAGIVPFDLWAEVLAAEYAGRRRPGADPRGQADEERQARQLVKERWMRRLLTSRASSQRAVGAVLPVFEDWLDRRHGVLTYRLTQVLTGHGCFGEYLCRMGAEATTECHECGAEVDSAQHTLEECPAFSAERRELRQGVGWDLSLPAVVAAMVDSERSWEAMASFCERVMSQKEAAERVRIQANPARRERERERRARRRRHVAPAAIALGAG